MLHLSQYFTLHWHRGVWKTKFGDKLQRHAETILRPNESAVAAWGLILGSTVYDLRETIS